MPITAVKNPIWHDEAKTILDVEVSLDNGATFHPYTAHPDGEIYRDAIAGKYGPIGSKPPVVHTAGNLAQYARMIAKRIMDGGISVNIGVHVVQVDTHAASLSGISRNLQLGTLNPGQKFEWVQSPSSITLNVAQMQTVAKAAYNHEQACWAVLSDVTNKISAGAITTKEQIDAYAWPKNS
jgi:hypothetical protein